MTIERPWRLIYEIGCGILAYAWFGWWGVILIAIAYFDVRVKHGHK